MFLSSRTATRIGEDLSRHVRRLSGVGKLRDPWFYFEPGEPRPGEPGYFDFFDRVNADFAAWLDPGEVTAPEPGALERRGRLVSFSSPLPLGHPDVDRVVVKVYPAPATAPDVGILFHHWSGLRSWSAVDAFLRPLTHRYRVAAMVAGHNLMRRRPGLRSGEGLINSNPRHILEGFRQWQADHLATLAWLERDLGFARTVVVGYSLGGYNALLNRLIRPPRPTVTICATNCYVRGIFEGIHAADVPQRLQEMGFTREGFDRATRCLHLARWATRIGGGDLTWIHARDDEIEPPDSLREAREALAPERVVEVRGGHSTAFVDRRAMIDEIVRRVERCVGSTLADDDSIA